MITAVVDPGDFIREPHLSWEFYPSWLKQELIKQGIQFKPDNRPAWHVLTMPDLVSDLLTPWSMTGADSPTNRIVVKQAPRQ